MKSYKWCDIIWPVLKFYYIFFLKSVGIRIILFFLVKLSYSDPIEKVWPTQTEGLIQIKMIGPHDLIPFQIPFIPSQQPIFYVSSSPIRRALNRPHSVIHSFLTGQIFQAKIKRWSSHLKSSFQLPQKYGSVFTLHLALNKVVVLAGYETIKQALQSTDAFGDRSVLPIIDDLKLTHGEELEQFYCCFSLSKSFVSEKLLIHRDNICQRRLLERDEALCTDQS